MSDAGTGAAAGEGAGAGGGAGARRASERDLPARLAAEPVKPSKSTPALHHAHAPPPSPHHAAALSPQSQTSLISSMNMSKLRGGAAGMAPSKSHSSHNLSAPNDLFYQNLSSVHAQQHPLQDRWSSLRSSTGSGRPQSAHFSATSPEQLPDGTNTLPHQVNQANAANARAAKLAEMSEEVTRRQQQQQQQQQMYQHHHQQQQQLQQQQQMQQHQLQQQQLQQQQIQQYQQQQQLQQKTNNYPNQQMHVHANMQPGQGMHMHSPQSQHVHAQYTPQMPQMHVNMHTQYSPAPQHMQPQNNQMYQNHAQSQRYDWYPPGPPSPQRSQPPVAPKPISQPTRKSETEAEDLYQQSQQPQQQASTVQPDDERYVASALEPPAVSVYPVGAPAARALAPHNPWQREERERQAEARRQANRARRDAAIAQLVSLGAARTPVQNQQLRALQLERDFERRATQHQDDNAGADGGGAEESPSPEPEPEPERERQLPPPKSILKTNQRVDLTNGYTHTSHTSIMEESRVSELSSSMANISVSSAGTSNPPPPPERGSSFAVMATRRLDAPAPAPHAPHAPHAAPHDAALPPPQSPVGGARDKRVSFHERAPPPPAPPASSPPPLDAPAAREDPDRFIEEAESMLAGGASPGAAAGAAPAPAHTPGVIGAQEVYRDPRARRLAEAQARAAPAPVPEQLSFKEKMKMFALESGEASTPKDKVKISRAQRDIDAVH
ncbi:unnamed protein product, partial [Brenthis ino]